MSQAASSKEYVEEIIAPIPETLPSRSTNPDDNRLYWGILGADKAGFYFRDRSIARERAFKELNSEYKAMHDWLTKVA